MGRIWQNAAIAWCVVCALGAAVIVGGGSLGMAAVAAPASAATVTAPTDTTAAVPTTDAPVSAQAVTQSSFSYTDSTRGASCAAISSSSRTIQGSVYYDASAPRPLPVLILAHGFDQGAALDAELLTQAPYYASRGYFVVLLRFPVSSGDVPPFNFHPSPVPGACAADIPNQPGDVSFLLTQLTTNPSGVVGGLPAGLFNPNRTGIEGISAGALTGLSFFNVCCTDHRIVAVLSFVGFPATSTFFGHSDPYDFCRDIPLFMLNGLFDTTLDGAASFEPGPPQSGFEKAYNAWLAVGAPKYFFEDPNPAFDHFAPFPLPPNAAAAVDAFLDRYVKGVTTHATLDALLADAGSPYYRYATEVEDAPTSPADPPCAKTSDHDEHHDKHHEVAPVPVAVQPLFTG
jgi:pimeloyl-ACP methyl ester carboxylesterase